MSALLVRPSGEIYVIEVVKKLTRSMPTKVTSNPVETGESISDHITLNNKTWILDCVISDATFRWLSDSDLSDNRGTNAVVNYQKGSSSYTTQVGRTPNPSTSGISVSTNRPGVGTGVNGNPSFTSRLRDAAGAQLGFLTQFFKRPIKVDVTQTGQAGNPNSVSTTITGSTNPAKVSVSTTPSGKVSAFDKYQLLEQIRDNREVLTLIHSSGTYDNLVITDCQPERDSTISVANFVFTLQLEQIQVIDKAKTTAIARLPKPAPRPTAAAADTCATNTENGKTSTQPLGPTVPQSRESSPAARIYDIWASQNI